MELMVICVGVNIGFDIRIMLENQFGVIKVSRMAIGNMAEIPTWSKSQKKRVLSNFDQYQPIAAR